MNETTNPDKAINEAERCKFAQAAPIMLAINLFFGVIMWLLRNNIFAQEADHKGAILAGVFVLSGILTYAVLKIMSNHLTRTEKLYKAKNNV